MSISPTCSSSNLRAFLVFACIVLVYHQHVKGGRRDIVRCISVGGGESYRNKYDVYVVDLGKDANFGAVLDGVDP